jgi:HD superfamily phosphohydrolase
MLKDFRASHKKVYDPIHGFIKFDDYEKTIIDTFAFQRLHNIHQLGGAYLVFPGATHSRFEHSLGVMELASRLYDKLCSSVRPDLFHFLPRKHSTEYIYWRKILRFAALCHDLGHLSFSHVAEKEILGENGHEKWTLKIMKSNFLKPVFEKIQEKLLMPISDSKKDIVEDIVKISIGEKILKEIDPNKDYKFNSWERILSEIIIGDFFGSDRIDYLLRDSKFTGVNYGLFDYLQLIEMLKILPKDDSDNENLELGIDENGIESCEALIVARQFMYRRVYKSPSVLSYNFHLKNFIKKFYEENNVLANIDKYLMTSDVNILVELGIAAKNTKHFSHEEAKKIMYRKGRFKTIVLSLDVLEKDLIQFKSKNKIPDEKIKWEMAETQEKIDLSFPVAKHQFTILKAKECSKLLSLDFLYNNTFVYIAPEYEALLIQSFKDNV